MNSDPPNPYQSPVAVEHRVVERVPPKRSFWGWRLIPTAILGLLGAWCFERAISSAIFVARWLAEGGNPAWNWYFAPLIVLGVSGCLLLASWLCWRRRFGAAMVATAVGFALPVVWEMFEMTWRLFV